MGADHGRHACACKKGGRPTARHDDVKNILAKWMNTELGINCLTEQRVTAWDRVRPHGAGEHDIEHAILDIVYTDHTGRQISIDVSVIDGAENTQTGFDKALKRREWDKHLRYPGPNLRAFVIDCRGRWGDEARGWLRSILQNVPQTERQGLIRSIRHTISASIQHSVADQIIAATAEPPS